MALILPSGSVLTLAHKCIGSVVLPQVKDEPGPAAIKGQEDHAKLEKFLKGGRIIAEDCCPEDRDLYSRLDRSVPAWTKEWPESGHAVNAAERCELPFIRSADSVEEFGYVDRSKYFVAVADLVQHSGGTSFAVWDWKTSGWVAEPEYNWQLILTGLRMYLLSECSSEFRCKLGIVYTHKPTDDGKFESVSSEFGADFFERSLKKLQFLQGQLELAEPSTVKLYEGKHCGYCNARARCPAKVGAFVDAVSAFPDFNVQDDRDLIKISRTLIDNKPQLDKMEKEILRRHGGELNLGDGRVAVLKTTEKNGKITEKVFTKHG